MGFVNNVIVGAVHGESIQMKKRKEKKNLIFFWLSNVLAIQKWHYKRIVILDIDLHHGV